jgi:2-methylcitrate dehydratase PrpD
MALVCEPIEQKRRAKVMIDAQFSAPFNVALGLVKKRVRFTDFTSQNFAAPEIERLMDCVTCRVEPALEAQYPGSLASLRRGLQMAARLPHRPSTRRATRASAVTGSGDREAPQHR